RGSGRGRRRAPRRRRARLVHDGGARPGPRSTRIRGRMQPLRLGLLSTASIGTAILRARSEDAPFRVVAVASRDGARAASFACAHGVPRSYASYDQLLAAPDVDAVYVALPNALHHEWTMRALRAGKHVLCEKPYSLRPDEVDEAWDEAERRELVLTEGYMWRHSRQTAL